MIWIRPKDVTLIHSEIIRKTGGIDGIRDQTILDSAISSPLQSFEGQDLFRTDVEKIARLGYGLASNHAFLDGNKRIGAMVTQLLMAWNQYKIDIQTGELSTVFISIANGQFGYQDLLSWISSKIQYKFCS